MSAWRSPHRVALTLGALLLVAAGVLALAGTHWRAVALLVLGSGLLAVVGIALRPRPAGAPRPAGEPTWFPASTDFARSIVAPPDTALPDLEQWRPTCERCGSPMVERSGSRQRSPQWVCADAPRCGYTVEGRRPESR
jgi:hypothetical protein